MTLVEGVVLANRYRIDDVVDAESSFCIGTVVESGRHVLIVDVGELLADGLRRAVCVADPRLATLIELLPVADGSLGVYELVEGTSLAERLAQQGTLELTDAVRLGAELAEGLYSLHRRGAPHGGVRPESVLVDAPERAGAVLAYAARPNDDSPYIPPERRGLPASPVDDVWALAALLFQAITGELPPLEGFVSSRAVRAKVPDLGLALVLARCLRADQDERVSMIFPVREALESWSAQPITPKASDPDVSMVASLPKGVLIPPTEMREHAARHSLPPPLPPDEEGRSSTVFGATPGGAARVADASAGDTPDGAASEQASQAKGQGGRRSPLALALGALGIVAAAAVASVVLLRAVGGGTPEPEGPPAAGSSAASSARAGGPVQEAESQRARAPGLAPQVGAAPERSAGPGVSAASSSAAPAPGAPAGSASAGSATATGQSVGECVAAHLPPKSFGKRPNLDWICIEQDARRGALKVRGLVVTFRGAPLTATMKQWSRMKWYTMPAYAALRRACCSGASVELPELDACPSITEPTNALARAVVEGTPRDPALVSFRKAITCQGKFHRATVYKQVAAPGGGEEAAFEKFVQAFR